MKTIDVIQMFFGFCLSVLAIGSLLFIIGITVLIPILIIINFFMNGHF